MQIQKTIKPHHPIVLALVILGVISLGFAGYALYSSLDDSSDDSQVTGVGGQQLTDEERQAKEDAELQQKKDFIESSENAKPAPPPSSSDNVSFKATQNGDSVVITTELTDFSAGTCTLTIKNGQKSFTDSVDIIYQPEFSICAGFSVPVVELGSGTWNITLSAQQPSTDVFLQTANLEVS